MAGWFDDEIVTAVRDAHCIRCNARETLASYHPRVAGHTSFHCASR